MFCAVQILVQYKTINETSKVAVHSMKHMGMLIHQMFEWPALHPGRFTLLERHSGTI